MIRWLNEMQPAFFLQLIGFKCFCFHKQKCCFVFCFLLRRVGKEIWKNNKTKNVALARNYSLKADTCTGVLCVSMRNISAAHEILYKELKLDRKPNGYTERGKSSWSSLWSGCFAYHHGYEVLINPQAVMENLISFKNQEKQTEGRKGWQEEKKKVNAAAH